MKLTKNYFIEGKLFTKGTEIEILQESKNKLPTLTGDTIADYQDKVEEIWNQYADAMSKRRPDSVLEFDRFHMYLYDAHYYESNGSYVIGQYKHDLFIPTHFAPKTLRGGVEIIKKLKEYDNVVFVVTDDLAPMLKKIGFKLLPVTVMKEFRGVDIEKTIAVSNLFHSVVQTIFGTMKDTFDTIKNSLIPKKKLKQKPSRRREDYNNSIITTYNDILEYALSLDEPYVGIRFENLKRNIGDVIYTNSKILPHDREFPIYGSPEYQELDELDGVSAWAIIDSWEVEPEFEYMKEESLTSGNIDAKYAYILTSDGNYADEASDIGEAVYDRPVVIATIDLKTMKLKENIINNNLGKKR